MTETGSTSKTRPDWKGYVIAGLITGVAAGVYTFNLGLHFNEKPLMNQIPASAVVKESTTEVPKVP